MQVLHARDVEVDRCAFCGGLWLDGGELQAAAGREVRIAEAPAPLPSRRSCPDCATALSPGRARNVLVEWCRSCHGVFLDDGELAQVAGAEVALRRPPEAQRKSEATFRCAGCGDHKPLDQGLATPRGLACPNCHGALDGSTAALAAAPSRVLGTSVGAEGMAGVAGSVLEGVVGLFLDW